MYRVIGGFSSARHVFTFREVNRKYTKKNPPIRSNKKSKEKIRATCAMIQSSISWSIESQPENLDFSREQNTESERTPSTPFVKMNAWMNTVHVKEIWSNKNKFKHYWYI